MTNIFLIDIDNTLIDMDKAKEVIFETIAKAGNTTSSFIKKIYKNQPNKFFKLDSFGRSLQKELGLETSKVKAIFDNFPYQDYLNEGALQLLETCAKLGSVVFYTKGDPKVQLPKLKSLNLINEAENSTQVIVSHEKPQDLLEVVKELQKLLTDKFYLIDDSPKVIEQAIKLKQEEKINLVPIWIEQGKYNEKGQTMPNNENHLSFAKINDLNQSLKKLLVPNFNPEIKG